MTFLINVINDFIILYLSQSKFDISELLPLSVSLCLSLSMYLSLFVSLSSPVLLYIVCVFIFIFHTFAFSVSLYLDALIILSFLSSCLLSFCQSLFVCEEIHFWSHIWGTTWLRNERYPIQIMVTRICITNYVILRHNH